MYCLWYNFFGLRKMIKEDKLMKRKLVVISIFLVVVVAFSFGIFKLKDNKTNASDTKIVVFHYQRNDNTYDNWNVWLWGKDGEEIGESKFVGMDEYGA